MLRRFQQYHPGEDSLYPLVISPDGRFVLVSTSWDGDGGSAGYIAWTHLLDRTSGKELAAFEGLGVFVDGGKRVAFWRYERFLPTRGLWVLDLGALPRPRRNGLLPLEDLGAGVVSSSEERARQGVTTDWGWYRRPVAARRVFPRTSKDEEDGEFYATGLSWHPATGEIVCQRDSSTRDVGLGLYAIRLRDARVRRLCSTGEDPQWSPDGRWVAFQDSRSGAEASGGHPGLVSRDGKVRKRLSSGFILGWQRSSGQLAFLRRSAPAAQEDATMLDLLRYSPKTGRETVVLKGIPAGYPVRLSPSGRCLAAVTGKRLWVLETHTGTVWNLEQSGVQEFAWGATDTELNYVLKGSTGGQEWRQVRLRIPRVSAPSR